MSCWKNARQIKVYCAKQLAAARRSETALYRNSADTGCLTSQRSSWSIQRISHEMPFWKAEDHASVEMKLLTRHYKIESSVLIHLINKPSSAPPRADQRLRNSWGGFDLMANIGFGFSATLMQRCAHGPGTEKAG
jgi:hypothetical protein